MAAASNVIAVGLLTDLIYISLLIIPCIIYYVTNKETLNLVAHETPAVVAQDQSVFPEGQPLSHDQGRAVMLNFRLFMPL